MNDVHEIPAEREAKWKLYESPEMIVRANASASSLVGDSRMPIRVGFALPLRNKSWPDDAEVEELNQCEELLRSEIRNVSTAIQVLAITSEIMREFVFYCSAEADIAALHESVREKVKTHQVHCRAVRDPDWEVYTHFTT